MSINFRELLIFVAIVTAALVMQVRQHTMDMRDSRGEAQSTRPVEGKACDSAGERHSTHLLRATCHMPREEQPVDERNAMPRARRDPLFV
ncbi:MULTISPECIES: hypothetical protein [unclassified Caballeronia]|uniref:hypothetical protein n=1 Tax=unclassified Caballeronia TaxID=2646786 RepID=UPI0028613D86|nr:MULTISPECIES: hypothetical protein [unclassified Caballeronia]MDR5749982.1 hypothetical protein [Caballeronia sp. LZ024]MDR5842890.1 hypothetical protein [Caballeronia sp. LZ031]